MQMSDFSTLDGAQGLGVNLQGPPRGWWDVALRTATSRC